MSVQTMGVLLILLICALVLSGVAYFWFAYRGRKGATAAERIQAWRYQSGVSLFTAGLGVVALILVSLDPDTAGILSFKILFLAFIASSAAVTFINDKVIERERSRS